MPQPSLPEFLDLATRHSVVPIFEKVLADRDTAVSAFEKLVGNAPGFLLESVEGGERWAQWSFLGWDPLFTLVARDGKVESEVAVPQGDPLAVLEEVIAMHSTPDLPGLPPLHSGLVGYLGYDCVRYIENLDEKPLDDLRLPVQLSH